ncbi:MAG: undecaprenyldiphospho-muramoylpentapeptide beta-N-acetylglucosaminyltransferase [Zoogloeaceae bacterium]|jgi:UDP-N-acetylglucosamine--N-acetylmuramyl-(pentapeptide) pyrophosphoryl-undecaprenol N-acetylglucosamine transferase|nr:undecaprenyldiphospho-muramoylpentapeptide beta-N-acetylglucosaminyltransferase [Zoogloeaceae bacterium]
MNAAQKTVLIMAGGTGGHIFPALSVAIALRDAGWRVCWLGNPEGMEARLAPKHGFEMTYLRFAALRGKGLARKLMLPIHLLCACWQAAKAIHRLRPAVVLGMGGYISFPGALMAWMLGIPLVIHEQNAIAGLANRVLSPLASRVLTGFPDVLRRGVWVGNPVRADILQSPPPEARFAGREGPFKLLVVGGSLGAQALNEAVPQGLALMPVGLRPEVVHQAGERHLETLRANYADAGVEAHCVSFIEDMAGAYAWADLAICRAGAITIAELAIVGVPAILVPFPHAVDDHQTHNARFLTLAGGGILLPQDRLTPESVALTGNYSRSQLLEMAKKSHMLARPDATLAVARHIEECAA